ncbi:MAG: hypothetical protein HC765_13840 [Brachymonas sp.]|nr:hypothetical protein [Brachymonas sp.]
MKIFKIVWIAFSAFLYLCLSFVIGGRNSSAPWDAGVDHFRQRLFQTLLVENNAYVLGFFVLHLCVTLMFFWHEVQPFFQRLGNIFWVVCAALLLAATLFGCLLVWA